MADEAADGDPRDAEPREDVLGKLDQLLNRHRPRASESESALVPVLTDAMRNKESPDADSVPTLTDVVAGPGQGAGSFRQLTSAKTTPNNSTSEETVLLRLTAVLESERARLFAMIGNDPERVRSLEYLIGELEHALPAVVRAAFRGDAVSDSIQPGDSGRL